MTYTIHRFMWNDEKMLKYVDAAAEQLDYEQKCANAEKCRY